MTSADDTMGNSGVQEMMTLVFMDLESTGLPTPGNYPRITELSMIAIDTVSLTTCQEKPRVRNKLTLCMYPMRTVSLGAFRITGLYNDNLLYQKDFDERTADLINMFLQRLAPPVCLVAHNGLHYDYPLLLAEYNRVGKSLPENLYVADSLPMFRVLDPDKRITNKLVKYEEPDEEIQQEITNSMQEDISDDLDENLNVLTPPQSMFKKDIPQNHKKSVKRKLFLEDGENGSSGVNRDPTSHKPSGAQDRQNSQEIVLFEDHDYEEDQADEGHSIAGSDATEDYYGTLPGLDDIMNEVEEAEKKTKLGESEWDSDLDDMDDDTLLSSSQQILDDFKRSQTSGSSQISELSQRSDCSSLLLTPPDSERKRSPPTYTHVEAKNAETTASQGTQRTVFKKLVIPSPTPATQEKTPSKQTFKKLVIPCTPSTPKQLSQLSTSKSSTETTPLKTPKFKKLFMDMPVNTPSNNQANVSSHPRQDNSLQFSQSSQFSQQTMLTNTPRFKKFVMPDVKPSATPSEKQSQASASSKQVTMPGSKPVAKASGTSKTKFVKFVMLSPKPSQTLESPSEQKQSTSEKIAKPASATNHSDNRSTSAPQPGPSWRRDPTSNSPQQVSASLKGHFKKLVIPSSALTQPTSASPQSNACKSYPSKQSAEGLANAHDVQSTALSEAKHQNSKQGDQGQDLKEPAVPHFSNDTVGFAPREAAGPDSSGPATVQTRTQIPFPKKSYRLERIYFRIFGNFPPESHKAEDDAVTLMRICYRRAQDVCDWIKENAKLFVSVVEPMYENKFNSSGLPQGVFPYEL